MFDFASRIAKLDAVSLDREFLSFLKREVTGLLTAFTKEEYLHRFTPEITLLVKYVIWKFTTSSTGSTIGQKLLGIKYDQIPGKLRLLFVLEGLIPYLIEKLHSFRDIPVVQRIQQPLKHIESLVKILSVVNFCLFLFQNRYPTLATRLLGLPIVSIHRRMGASAGYSYQIRELLWHQFADFLITILPLINFQKMKRSITQLIQGSNPTPSPDTPSVSSTTTSVTNGNDTVTNETSSDSQVVSCSICKEDAVIPQRIGTEYFCYFCYQGVFEEGF